MDMGKIKTQILLVITSFILLASPTTSASTIKFSFTKIIDESSFSNFGPAGSINNDGMVAFQAFNGSSLNS